MMIVFLLIALTSASNVELAILSCKLQFQLPPSPNFLDTNISFLYSILFQKSGRRIRQFNIRTRQRSKTIVSIVDVHSKPSIHQTIHRIGHRHF